MVRITIHGKSLALGLVILLLGSASCGEEVISHKPNIVLVMTDDQGFGDVGFHGNPQIETPNLDRLASQSIEMTNFYVSPVCAPTRASLMTGRYNYRTGVVDTYIGRAMMYPDETTLAELLSDAGYRTGIFGKWHLGDNYPLRAMDQGFQESFVHRGGGIGQPSDPPGNRYFDPILMKNGVDVKASGYCTDIFFEAAEDFIRENSGQPFFAYIATNAPHTPLQVSPELVEPYLAKGLDDTTARIYAMVSNIDENMGQMLALLEELGITENTILIFLTDNGPQQDRYNSNLRGRKASVYEGGIRVPFLIRWPARFASPGKRSQAAAHIDVLPTLLEACGLNLPEEIKVDGINLLPVLDDENASLPDRELFIQSHRGDVPEKGRACAIRGPKYKLVQAVGWPEGPMKSPAKWELFDLSIDPGEQNDLAELQPEVVDQMKSSYYNWFDDVSSERGFDPPRIHLGTPHENPVTLTRQDWRGPRASWSTDGLGYWEVSVVESGNYRIVFRFSLTDQPGAAELRVGSQVQSREMETGMDSIEFGSVPLTAGPHRLEAILRFADDKSVGVQYVDVYIQE